MPEAEPAHADPSAGSEPYLRAAILHLQEGNAKVAVQAASEACRAAPHSAEAHYAYGEAWLALAEFTRAERAFAEAVKLAPHWADAWVNYGVARYRQGAIGDAKAAMRHALSRQPDHAAALANLGAFMRISGESDRAEAFLRAAIERQPTNVGARLNLAADLLQEERAAEALAMIDAPAAPSGQSALLHWRLQRSMALLQLGRAGEARQVIEEMGDGPAALAPLILWRRVLLASQEGDGAASRDLADRMEQALRLPGPMIPEHRIMAWYDLAKFWSREGRSDRAFPCWTEGHRLLGPSQPFSREAYRDFVDATVECFDRQRLRDGPRASNRDAAPVFIVGMPRSGTTLAEQIIAAHAQVHGAGERDALGNVFRALGGGWESPEAARHIAALDRPALDAAAESYLSALHALAPGKARIVDKMPGNFAFLGLAALMLPGARIIHCTRDPRDIGLSIFTFRFYGHHPYAHDLGDLGWYIGQHNRLMTHWRAVLPNPILDLRLNDWVEDFDGTLRRVLDFLDLSYDPACERFHESDTRVRTVSRAQVKQPVNARGIGRWCAYARHLQPLIVELDKAGALAAWAEPAVPRLFKPENPEAALAQAAVYLMSKPAFAALPFGEWMGVLVGQINRGHFFFVIDERRKVQGFAGWALTTRDQAEAWLAGQAHLAEEVCREGDCVIINVWAAESRAALRLMVNAMREIGATRPTLYFKRHYPDGRTRVIRLATTDFVASHLARARSSAASS